MTIVPAKRSLTIWRGSTFSKRYVYLDAPPDDLKDIPVGSTAELRVFHDEGTALFPCTVVIAEAAINLHIDAEDTYPSWKHPRYELKLIGPEGVTNDTLVYGSVKFKGEDDPYVPPVG